VPQEEQDCHNNLSSKETQAWVNPLTKLPSELSRMNYRLTKLGRRKFN